MSFSRDDRLRANLRLLVGLYVPTLAVLALAMFLSIRLGIPMADFTRDPAAIVLANPFIGWLSNLGILIWAACAAICFFVSRVLHATDSSKEESRFFLFAGLVTVMLLLDDLFMLHERVFLRYLGAKGWKVFSVYAVLIVAFVIRFRPSIARSGFWIFALGLAFFALSVGVDLLPDHVLPWHHLFEDGFKLLGIVSWFGYFANIGLERVS